jgi:exopolysaccharide biosynthesis WecB/TagA/CpsF family protein
MSNRVNILNVEIDNNTQKELLDQLTMGVLVTPNVDHLVKLQQDKDYYQVVKNTEWVICDSRILFLCSKLLKNPLVESVPGSSFFQAFYEYHKNDENCKIFLLGSMNDGALRAQQAINDKVGRNIVVGAFSPSYGFDRKPEENDRICQMINDSGATVVLVGVGCPKQEKWIAAHKDKMPGVKIWMALGATIDFEAGLIKRAPVIWQKMYLEWFYRFLQEPRRLFKRYFIDDPKFFWYFGKQLLGIYKDPFSHETKL